MKNNKKHKPPATANVPFSLIIPAFNEEAVIEEMLESLVREPIDFEIIVVNDGSHDRTAELTTKFIEKYRRKKRLVLISHPYNKGYGAALKTGIRSAKGEYVMFFDADGQHDSEDIERLLKPLEQFDMVVGARTNVASPLVRRPGMKVLKWLSEYLVGRRIPDLNSGFRAARKEALEKFFHLLPNGFSFTTTITLAMFEAGYSVTFVPIAVKRRSGKSTVSYKDAFKMVVLILRTMTLFNPLKVFLPASAFLFLVGTILFVRDAVRLDITLKTVMILLSSIIVFFFGLLSDQVSLLRKDHGRSGSEIHPLP